jgi:hypothetical protein
VGSFLPSDLLSQLADQVFPLSIPILNFFGDRPAPSARPPPGWSLPEGEGTVPTQAAGPVPSAAGTRLQEQFLAPGPGLGPGFGLGPVAPPP